VANEQNLIPNSERTPSELREITRKGGIASGEARRRKKRIKEDLDALLEAIGDNGKTNQENIAVAMIAKALGGDIRAAEFIRDTIGEKPETDINLGAAQALNVSIKVLDE
jgi:hypothetical protein